jgi:hypothetical protein
LRRKWLRRPSIGLVLRTLDNCSSRCSVTSLA